MREQGLVLSGRQDAKLDGITVVDTLGCREGATVRTVHPAHRFVNSTRPGMIVRPIPRQATGFRCMMISSVSRAKPSVTNPATPWDWISMESFDSHQFRKRV